MAIPKEKTFEDKIVNHLVNVNGFRLGDSKKYGRSRCMNLDTLCEFLSKTQPKEFKRIMDKYPVIYKQELYNVIEKTKAKHIPACIILLAPSTSFCPFRLATIALKHTFNDWAKQTKMK